MIRPTPEQLKLLTRQERLWFEIADTVNRTPLTRTLTQKLQRSIGRGWVRASTKNLSRLYDTEHLHALQPDRGVLFVCNHRSFFDFYVVSANLYEHCDWINRLFFPVRSTFFYEGALGNFVNMTMSMWAMFPPILRDAHRKDFNQYSVAFVEEALQHRGTVVGYHPEGTRSKSDDPYTLLPAQPGVGAIIHRARPIVVPVFVLGLINDLPRQVRSNFVGTGEPVNIVFGPPLDLSAFYAQPAEPATWRAISEAVCAEIARLGALERAYRLRDGIKPFNPRA